MKKYKISHNVDMQRDFVMPDGKMYVAGADKLITPMNRFLSTVSFDKNIVSMDTHNPKTYGNFEESKLFDIHCADGTPGWELTVKYTQPNTIIKKNFFDIWQANAADMDQALHGFTPDNTDVYLFGVASDFCVRYALDGYLQRGYDVHVIENLCRGIEKQITDVVHEDSYKKYIRNNQLQLNVWQQMLTKSK